MKKPDNIDFWYAVNNTDVVLAPSQPLETFGSTLLNYHLVSEKMDSVGVVTVRTGRMQTRRPEIITPSAYAEMVLEGFGGEAKKYADWLREHDSSLNILRYGFTLRQEAFSEETVTDSLDAVVDRVKKSVEDSNDPFGAVLRGVDEPWDVCLVKLFWTVVQRSAKSNIMELAKHHMFDRENGLPLAVRQEIEQAFAAAKRDRSLVQDLGRLLKRHGAFGLYEARFFSLFN